MMEDDAIVDNLLSWADKNGRDFPWRSVQDPYHLAAAEILLQRTKAQDAESVWLELIRCFPSPKTLIQAPDMEVQKIVGKLGLGNQRTQRLKSMASSIMAFDEEGFLPGLGSYGIQIILLSLGKKSQTIPVDTNIARIICRYYGLSFEQGEARKKPEVRSIVKKLLNVRKRTADKLRIIYALVDFGAIICTSVKPRCSICLLSPGCSFTERSSCTPEI